MGGSTFTRRCFAAVGALALVVGVGPRAYAVDGVIEINQTRAQAGGVTPTDTAGFPVTIDTAGSYRLTSNLDVTGEPTPENVTAVSIAANNVTLDLNGFSIIGPGVTGFGIGVLGGHYISVINGTIRGMGGVGVSSSGYARVERLTVLENGTWGIFVGIHSHVVENIVSNNGSDGIYAISPSIIRGNTVEGNGDDGIQQAGGGGGIVIGNTVWANSGWGLNLGPSSGYADNHMLLNTAGTVLLGIQMGTNICDGNTTCP